MDPDSDRPGILRLVLAGLTVIGYGVFALVPDAFFPLGVDHLGVWFLDSFAILASNDALQRGLDPYGLNPLDYFQREHVYSHWWLWLRHLGLTREHNFWVGMLIGLSFVTAALAWLRPRTSAEMVWYLAVLVSPPLLLGFNRANNDLVVFVLLGAISPCLLSANRTWRFLAAMPVALAAGLKFYPAIAGLVLLAGTDPRETRRRVLFAAALLGLVAVSVAPDVGRIQSIVPRANGLMTFSAFNLLEFLGASGGLAVGVGLILAALAVAGFLRLRVFEGWRVAPTDRSWLGFVLGASLLVGCFFTGTNHAYRWIFAVWLAPLLWSLSHDGDAPPRARRFAGLTAGLMIFALWFDPMATGVLASLTGRYPAEDVLRRATQFFLLEQPVTWAFFWCLLGFLTHFGCEAWRHIVRRNRPIASRTRAPLDQGNQVMQ
jgi:hypothetical protein